ncbi:MAG: phospholipid-binding protein [Hyphomicrobiales bacterium]|nr:MAG: phospholipid-binding protein [Hyphomicrobiales bacterium]
MSFSWGPTKKCFDSKSPPISMRGVPKGTAKLRFRMIDQDAPNYPHGGGTVKWTGKGSLPYGAFRYKGPCPPRPHTYQITVEALDKSNKVLAKARAKRRFP